MLHNASDRRHSGQIGGPTCMSTKQMGDYLNDLRTNRVQRPSGSRPLPPPASTTSSRRRSQLAEASVNSRYTTHPSLSSHESFEQPPPKQQKRSSSRLSLNNSLDIAMSLSGRISPEKTMYVDWNTRQQEREEARKVREDLEQVDIETEDRIEKAGMKERSELIRKHRNPSASMRSRIDGSQAYDDQQASERPALPQDYPLHDQANMLATVKGHERAQAQPEIPSEVVVQTSPHKDESIADAERNEPTVKKRRSLGGLSKRLSLTKLSHRRSSSAAKRNVSGEVQTEPFPNEENRIYEDPSEEPDDDYADILEDYADEPQVPEPPVSEPPKTRRRNPFARARQSLSRSPERKVVQDWPQDRVEIYRNEPTQTRNPSYTKNPTIDPKESLKERAVSPEEGIEVEGVKYKNGVEVRNDELRAATSMRKSARSPRLPSPTAVSTDASRPIISFDPNWKPPEEEVKSPNSPMPYQMGRPAPSPTTPHVLEDDLKSPSSSAPVVPTLSRPPAGKNTKNVERTEPPVPEPLPLRKKPTFDDLHQQPSQPQHSRMPRHDLPASGMNKPDQHSSRDVPRMNLPRETETELQPPQPPVINIDDADVPSMNVDAPSAPSIQIDAADSPPNSRAQPQPRQPFSQRPPEQGSQMKRPPPKHAATSPGNLARPNAQPNAHWSPSVRRNVALCAQCALPISGRIITAAGAKFHQECFTCYHCHEALECVAFYPEPAEEREARLERNRRRMEGEDIEGEEDDGDDSLRFYCHLDYHEFFSPRCKSCKTPIEGQVILACGAQWHVGHFFCAQCGDPFDPSTPFVEKDGYAWCVNCHTNRFSPKCKKCKRPVAKKVINALGAEWHEECFRCMECNGGFDDGRFFVRGESQDPVCVACEERRLKL